MRRFRPAKQISRGRHKAGSLGHAELELERRRQRSKVARAARKRNRPGKD